MILRQVIENEKNKKTVFILALLVFYKIMRHEK